MEKSAYAFRLEGNPVRCEVFGHGHINHTLKLTTDTGAEYILQRINTYVFKDPIRLMENVSSVTNFLRQRVSDPRMALRLIPTYDGKYYHIDEHGEYWRAYNFVFGYCLDTPETDEDFYQSALAFGRFQEMLSDFPAESLYETIPNSTTPLTATASSRNPWLPMLSAVLPVSRRRSTSCWSGRSWALPCRRCGKRVCCLCA